MTVRTARASAKRSLASRARRPQVRRRDLGFEHLPGELSTHAARLEDLARDVGGQLLVQRALADRDRAAGEGDMDRVEDPPRPARLGELSLEEGEAGSAAVSLRFAAGGEKQLLERRRGRAADRERRLRQPLLQFAQQLEGTPTKQKTRQDATPARARRRRKRRLV